MTRDGGPVRGVARLVHGLFVDELANGAVFFSLIVIVGALVTQNAPFLALGVVVGLGGMAIPWWGMHRRWPDTTMLLAAVSVLVTDGATGWLLWQYA